MRGRLFNVFYWGGNAGSASSGDGTGDGTGDSGPGAAAAGPGGQGVATGAPTGYGMASAANAPAAPAGTTGTVGWGSPAGSGPGGTTAGEGSVSGSVSGHTAGAANTGGPSGGGGTGGGTTGFGGGGGGGTTGAAAATGGGGPGGSAGGVGGGGHGGLSAIAQAISSLFGGNPYGSNADINAKLSAVELAKSLGVNTSVNPFFADLGVPPGVLTAPAPTSPVAVSPLAPPSQPTNFTVPYSDLATIAQQMFNRGYPTGTMGYPSVEGASPGMGGFGGNPASPGPSQSPAANAVATLSDALATNTPDALDAANPANQPAPNAQPVSSQQTAQQTQTQQQITQIVGLLADILGLSTSGPTGLGSLAQSAAPRTYG